MAAADTGPVGLVRDEVAARRQEGSPGGSLNRCEVCRTFQAALFQWALASGLPGKDGGLGLPFEGDHLVRFLVVVEISLAGELVHYGRRDVAYIQSKVNQDAVDIALEIGNIVTLMERDELQVVVNILDVFFQGRVNDGEDSHRLCNRSSFVLCHYVPSL